MISFGKHFSDNKVLWLLSFSTVAMLIFSLTFNKEFLEQQTLSVAVTVAQQQFGSSPLAPEQEAMIRKIAHETGVTRSVIIRKMNTQALAQFGYCNALAFNLHMCYLIPIDSVSLLFVSEGFFEDLTPEEQRFLIGHEMIHIKHGHLGYLPLFICLLFLSLAACSLFLLRIIYKSFAQTIKKQYQTVFMISITLLLFFSCSFITQIASFAYRRHIEKEADCESMKLLGSYNGCLQLTDRWQQEYNIALHNPYFSIMSDHPSVAERKTYCLELQNLHNQKDQA